MLNIWCMVMRCSMFKFSAKSKLSSAETGRTMTPEVDCRKGFVMEMKVKPIPDVVEERTDSPPLFLNNNRLSIFSHRISTSTNEHTIYFSFSPAGPWLASSRLKDQPGHTQKSNEVLISFLLFTTSEQTTDDILYVMTLWAAVLQSYFLIYI